MEEIRFDPIERKEFFLAKLGGQEITPPDAVTRIEHYLQDIIDGNASTIPPITRMEYYLAKISGADVAVPDPVTRTEYYLAKIAGMDVEPPDPITRLDYFLAQWVETGGGVLETVTGNAPITLTNALAKAMVSLTQYGLCTQASTPTPADPVPIKCNNGTLKWDSVNQRVYADGTPEVLTVSGKNLLNTATNITGKYITASGGISNGDDAQYTDLIPVKAGETYVASLVSGRNSGNNRWHAYDANGTWVKQLAYVSATGQQGAKLAMAVTIDSGISYVRLSYGITDTEAMISTGIQISADGYYVGLYTNNAAVAKRKTPIQSPYTSEYPFHGPAIVFSVLPGKIYAGKTNAVTNYTKIGYACYNNIEDVADQTKAVSRGEGAAFVAPDGANYAVFAYINSSSGVTFTFDEPFASEIGDYQPYVPPQTASVPMLLSVGDVKDEVELIAGTYKHRCAACEYDGTQDVGDTYLSTTGGKDIGAIIVYPLATPTTEQITGQNLVTNEGTNVVNVTAEVSPIELEAEYMAVAP